LIASADLNDPEGACRAWKDRIRVNPFAKAPDGQPVMELHAAIDKDAAGGKASVRHERRGK